MPGGYTRLRTMSRPTYRDACRAFRWEESARALGWAAGEPVSLGHTLVDRHAGRGRPALRWLGRHGEDRTYSFDELGALTGRFASVLRAHGVGRGRPGRGLPAPRPRDADRDDRHLEGRRGLRADLHRVRPGRGGVPGPPQRGPGPGHAPGASRAPARARAGRRDGHDGRRARRGRAGRHRVLVRDGSADGGGRPGRVPTRRAGGAAVHLRLDRAAEGREDRHQLPDGDPSAPRLRRRSPARRRLLADRRSRLGLRAGVLHGRARPRGAGALARGGPDRPSSAWPSSASGA